MTAIKGIRNAKVTAEKPLNLKIKPLTNSTDGIHPTVKPYQFYYGA